MTLNSLDVQNKTFPTKMRGYNKADVDDFLDLIIRDYDTFAEKIKDQERELKSLRERVEYFEGMKESLNKSIVVAQSAADNLKEQAINEAGAGAGDLAGTYRLLSVDGKNVPAVITHENAKVEIRSGSLTINNDGTCVSKMTFVPPSGKEGSQEVSATYSRNGDKLDMEWKEMGKTTGTLQGSTFTMNNEGMVLVYQK